MNLSSFWIEGFMPVQFLLVLAVAFFAFIVGQSFLKKIGKPIPAFGQAVLIPLTAYGVFKYLLDPTIPSNLMYQYMGLAVIFTFLLISSREQSWIDFKRTITATVAGETQRYRFCRAAISILLPLLAGFSTYNLVKPPEITEPIELRTYNPAPPQMITVYPPEYFIKK